MMYYNRSDHTTTLAPTLSTRYFPDASPRLRDVLLVVAGTPIDLKRIIKINKPSQPVRYEFQEIGKPTLTDLLKAKFGK